MRRPRSTDRFDLRWFALVIVASSIVASCSAGSDSDGSLRADPVERESGVGRRIDAGDSADLFGDGNRSNTANTTPADVADTVLVEPDRPIVPASTIPPATPPAQDDEAPAVVARPIPVDPPTPPPDAPPPPWAASTRTTTAGLLSTDVGCAEDLDAGGLDRFLSQRVGPVLGWDYQHVTWLGGDRSLWIFQDAFIDHSGTAGTLDRANFVHNAALIEESGCFRLLHGGTAAKPRAFEPGNGTETLTTWFWPMGSEVHGGDLHVVWVQMVKDAVDPQPPDGLGWHPVRTWIGTYDVDTLARRSFRAAPDSGVSPIYGYAMESDENFTYLFGNSFEQNLAREGGYWNGPHSATEMFLARVPVGRVFDAPDYRTADGWSPDAGRAVPILSRHWAEFPMQPRFLSGQWVAVAAVDGYWDDIYSVDVARQPWGPWTTVESRSLQPRGGDPKMNTYHAHLVPWRNAEGALIVTLSNNARDMLRDAWQRPERYRPMVFNSAWVAAPTPPAVTPTSTTTTTTITTTSTTTITTSTTSTTSTTTTTSTTVPPTTTSSTTTSTVPTSTSTTSSTVVDVSVPATPSSSDAQ